MAEARVSVVFDILFKDALVLDGSGAPAFRADVAVADGHIAAIGELGTASATRVVEAAGMALSPGFIDVHSHSDLPLLVDPLNPPKVRQGVTTELLGADGLSYSPLKEPLLTDVRRYLAGLYGNPPIDIPSESVAAFLARLDRQTVVNTVYVVPHQALRLLARGWRAGPCTDAELAHMADLLEQGLAEGARGLGTGLDYFPHGTCPTDELIALSKVVARHDGVLVAHVRYAIGVVEAVREMVRIAEQSGVRVLVSHMRNAEALPVIDDARARGVDIWFDTYPYNAGSSLFLMWLPFWAHEGGPTEFVARLRDPRARERLRAERHPRMNGDLTTIILTNSQYAGRSFASVMELRGQTDPVDAMCDLLLETDLSAGFISHGGSDEEGLRTCIQHPAHLASTDAVLVGRPHPRAYGTYPRYLGRYVREFGLLSLEDCIRRMTSAPAACLRLRERGSIRTGFAADLVLFDPATVVDRATYEDPMQYPDGIRMVVVNGEVVFDGDQPSGVTPGRALVAQATEVARASRTK
jgi:N-acyl-D-amino-acid deacylase